MTFRVASQLISQIGIAFATLIKNEGRYSRQIRLFASVLI